MSLKVINVNIGYYTIGSTFCVDYTITNDKDKQSGNIAKNVKVILTLSDGLDYYSETGVIPKGVLDEENGIWEIGSMLPCQSLTASFCFKVEDDCEGPFLIQFEAEMDECDCELTVSHDCAIINGISCCELKSCDKISYGDYANDDQAAADDVPVGGHYFNTTNGVMHTRLS